MTNRTRRAPARVLTALAAATLLAACQGDNLYKNLPTESGGGGVRDAVAPTVEIQEPQEGTNIVVGDSILVRVRVTDDQAIDSLRLSGFALRGDASLGTQQQVDRFATKIVTLADTAALTVVRDTVITRYLVATADTLPESPVLLVATATDTTGNVGADTVRIGIEPRPTIRFAVSASARAEQGDSLTVAVFTSPTAPVSQVGATVVVVRRTPSGTDTLLVSQRVAPGRSGVVSFPLEELGVPATLDNTSTLGIEVTAFAIDNQGRCFAAVEQNKEQSLPCRAGPGGAPLAGGTGFVADLRVFRGQTVAIANPTDRLVDIKSDGQYVYVSNFSRNRVEVLPVGGNQFVNGGIRVGSEPWGLALNPTNTELFVANSGGTNISRISIGGALPSAEDAGRRIQTPNLRIAVIPFDPVTGEPLGVSAGPDYSDRPQFIAQTRSGTLLYSTKPTPARPAGTVRRYNLAEGQEELFTGDDLDPRSPLAVAVDSARFIPGTPGDSVNPGIPNRVRVCRGSQCFEGSALEIADEILETDFGAQLSFGPLLPPLTDTTYVAVSGDHGTVVFGEGATIDARIFRFEEADGGLLVNVGDVDDLVGNASEEVIGLSLNRDGSVGIARGRQAYFFNEELRLLGVVTTGVPTGGVAMNPSQGACPQTSSPECIAFVSGLDATRGPYLDIVDTFHFCSIGRIFLAEPITRAITVVPNNDGSNLRYRVYGITERGVVSVEVFEEDLRGCR